MSTILAFDIGATKTRIAVFEIHGDALKVLGKRVRQTPLIADGVGFAEAIADEAEKLVDSLGVGVDAVGVGTIGPLDIRRGVITSPPNIKAKMIPLKDVLGDRFGKPVRIVNDCVAAVYAEHLIGAGKGYRNVVYVTLSTGIGAGAIVDGHLLLGKDGNAHEVGHIVLAYNVDVRCNCGGMGHWEALAGGANVWRLARLIAIGWRGAETRFYREALTRPITAEDLFKHYYGGDEFAKTVMEEFLDINAAGLASVVNIYDPEVLVLGGSIVLNNKWVVETIGERMKKFITNRMPRLAITPLGDDVVLYGAALIAAKPPKHLLEIQGG